MDVDHQARAVSARLALCRSPSAEIIDVRNHKET